jgi:hypothetical protein
MKICIAGTQAYGPATEGSDLDIVILKQDALALDNDLTERGFVLSQTKCQLENMIMMVSVLSWFLTFQISNSLLWKMKKNFNSGNLLLGK